MRSRGTEGAGGAERDLIEAGLSEPAGWRAAMGIVCCAAWSETPIGGRLCGHWPSIAIGGEPIGERRSVAGAQADQIASPTVALWPDRRFDGEGKAIPPARVGVPVLTMRCCRMRRRITRCRPRTAGATERRARQDGERRPWRRRSRGSDRTRAWLASSSTCRRGLDARRGAPSSWRQSASFAARWPLARKP